MVRGTYLPLPVGEDQLLHIINADKHVHTGLREEGGESMVIISGLTLLGEEAVRLSRELASS